MLTTALSVAQFCIAVTIQIENKTLNAQWIESIHILAKTTFVFAFVKINKWGETLFDT